VINAMPIREEVFFIDTSVDSFVGEYLRIYSHMAYDNFPLYDPFIFFLNTYEIIFGHGKR